MAILRPVGPHAGSRKRLAGGIEESKLVAYALDPASERGRHKARRFAAHLGYALANWQDLRRAILDALPDHDATFRSETAFGTKYEVVLPITGPNGNTAVVRTIWQYDRGADGTLAEVPRLITLYIP